MCAVYEETYISVVRNSGRRPTINGKEKDIYWLALIYKLKCIRRWIMLITWQNPHLHQRVETCFGSVLHDSLTFQSCFLPGLFKWQLRKSFFARSFFVVLLQMNPSLLDTIIYRPYVKFFSYLVVSN